MSACSPEHELWRWFGCVQTPVWNRKAEMYPGSAPPEIIFHCGANVARIFSADSERSVTALRRTWWTYVLVVLCDWPEPELLEAVPSFSDSSRREHPHDRTSITRALPNSLKN